MYQPVAHHYIPSKPLETFEPFVSYAPWFTLMTSPMWWWVNAVLIACGNCSEAMVRAMVFPCELPPTPPEPALSTPSNHTDACGREE